jgi:hypothetical protein
VPLTRKDPLMGLDWESALLRRALMLKTAVADRLKNGSSSMLAKRTRPHSSPSR